MARFAVFDKSNTKGIVSNRFTKFHIDKDGTMYAGAEDSGLMVYRDGRFVSYTPADGFPFAEVTDFGFDALGEFVINSPTDACYFRNGKFPLANRLPPNSRFYFAPTGKLWTADENGVSETKNGQIVRYALKLDFSSSLQKHLTFFEDSRGRLWLGVYSEVYLLENRSVIHFTSRNDPNLL